MEIRKVGVLGCGLMGSGIAQICATAGYDTIVREVNDAFLQKGIDGIRKFSGKMFEKGQSKVKSDIFRARSLLREKWNELNRQPARAI